MDLEKVGQKSARDRGRFTKGNPGNPTHQGRPRTPQEVKDAMRERTAVYFAATGGAGALLAQRIVGNETIAYPELGAEAIARLEVKDFPVIVVNDCHGGDLYEEGRAQYAKAEAE